MKSFSDRLILAMSKRNIKQSDLVKQTGINKGALSSYINGRYEPKQNNIYLLAKALNVNEAWLMGYDVPMDKETNKYIFGSELEKDLKRVSDKLDLPIEVVKTIFTNLKLDTNLELNYNNILLETEKYLMNKFIKEWNNQSNELNAHFSGFYYLLNSIGWTYQIKEDSNNETAYYELSNGDLKLKVSNEEFSKLKDNITEHLKDEIQDLIIKSSNIFDNK